MRYLLLFLSLFLVISCKEKTVKKTPPKKIETIQRDKPYEGKILKIDTTLYAKFESQVLVDFYKKYNDETVWQSTEFRKTVLNEFKNAENEGLFPDDYRFDKLNKLENKIAQLDDKELVDYDLLLTYNLQKYIWHISQGKLNPKEIYDDWDLQTKKTDVNAVLLKAFKENNLQTTLDSCKPQHIVYKRLKKAMEILNSFPKDTLKTISSSEKISPNDTTKSMISIKRKLMYWKDLGKQDSLTSIYDAKTVEAVKKFQIRHGLAADGVIGKGTLNALNFSKTKRKNQIMANLERWKWFSQKMGNEYVIINIPDYKLLVVENNDTVRTHRTIVGTIKRKTPVLNSKLSYAVFNPTWTVPPTILKEDIIPATIKNRGYLASKNITVYDNAGNVVSASDWNPSKARGYRYVQSPGSFNSLGMVKIIFPNKYSVYLHDTNHRDYFEKWNRSLSSGCVRVDNPLELTSYLLKDSINYNLEKITEILKTGETKNASIKSPVYVHQWYWTAWSENNKLVFRDDIYNLDDDLFKKMK
jgi:murein L,D-transpeptidase YcbB/YkuD